MKSNPALPGGSLVSKPTWSNTSGCSATSAFFCVPPRGVRVCNPDKEVRASCVLSRKNRESVVVGGTDRHHRLLKVTVLEIAGAKVKLGFETDREVPVHRWEGWERIRTGTG